MVRVAHCRLMWARSWSTTGLELAWMAGLAHSPIRDSQRMPCTIRLNTRPELNAERRASRHLPFLIKTHPSHWSIRIVRGVSLQFKVLEQFFGRLSRLSRDSDLALFLNRGHGHGLVVQITESIGG